MITLIENLSQFQQFINSNDNAIVGFFASFCGPCRITKPVFISLSERYPVKMGMVDVSMKEIFDYAKINSVPTVRKYRNGGIVDEVSGANMSAIEILLKN